MPGKVKCGIWEIYPVKCLHCGKEAYPWEKDWVFIEESGFCLECLEKVWTGEIKPPGVIFHDSPHGSR